MENQNRNQLIRQSKIARRNYIYCGYEYYIEVMFGVFVEEPHNEIVLVVLSKHNGICEKEIVMNFNVKDRDLESCFSEMEKFAINYIDEQISIKNKRDAIVEKLGLEYLS